MLMTTKKVAVDDIEAALDTALAGSVAGLTDDQLCDWLFDTPRLRAKFEALVTRVTREADVRCVAATRKHRRTDHLIGAETNASTIQTRADIRLGTWLDDFAELDMAFADGLVGREHLEVLRKSADNVRTRGPLLRDQRVFIEAAHECTFEDFRKAVGYWLGFNDPDGDEPNEQIASSRLSARRRADGTVKLSGTLDPLQGEAFINALGLETNKLQSCDDDTDQQRPIGKRNADALMGLVIRGHNNPQTSAAPRALIHIVMSETVAEQTLARLDNPFGELDLDAIDIDGRCEFADGTPVHPKLALATLGVGELRRVVMGAKSRAIDVSHAARSFPQWMKEAMIVESRGQCTTPGCTAPLNWLQGDHIKPHAKDGLTRLDNGQSICGGCNQHKSDTWECPPPTGEEPDTN